MQTAGGSTIVGDEPPPSEDEVRVLLRSWRWRRIVTPVEKEGFRVRRRGVAV